MSFPYARILYIFLFFLDFNSLCLPGTLTIVWLFCWVLFVYDTPAKHPKISQAEKKFIESSLAGIKNNKVRNFFKRLAFAFNWIVKKPSVIVYYVIFRCPLSLGVDF